MVNLTVIITNTSLCSVDFKNNGTTVFNDKGRGKTETIEVEKNSNYQWSCVLIDNSPVDVEISPSSGTIMMDSDKTLNITVSASF